MQAAEPRKTRAFLHHPARTTGQRGRGPNRGRAVMRGSLRSLVFAASAVFGTGIFVPPATAQSGADFFKGKTVTYIVATAPGGGYDLYGRLVAEYMQKYLPGSTFIVKNVPGAGNLIGTNLLYASKADGLTIGTFNTGLIYAQMVGREGIRFDLTKLSWIGKSSSDPRVITINAKSPIKSF